MTANNSSVTPAQEELGVSPPPGQVSCANCPSAMSSSELQSATGKGIGAPVCAIKLIPLVRPDQNERVRARVLNKTASVCKDYGKPRPTPSANLTEAPISYGPVGLAMPTVGAPTEKGRVPTCLGCIHYVGPAKVASDTQWTAGLCRAKGRLLTPDRLRIYAQACDVSVPRPPGSPEGDMMGFMLNPEYSQSFGEVDREALIKRMRSTDPGDWPTEKDVTEEDKEYGIKAWRKISDPEGVGADVFLPIFDDKFFDDAERAIIPRTGDRERPELYRDHDGVVYKMAVLMVGMEVVPAAWGPPGVGKTELGRHLAWLMVAPFARISITGESQIDDIMGKMMYSKERGTYFKMGRIPNRWIRPGVTVLDEPNTGPNEIWQSIRPMTDNSRQLVVDQSDDPVPLSRHRYSLLYLAMNQAHDARNVGTNVIADADSRRLFHVMMSIPPRATEIQIIRDHCTAVHGFDPGVDALNKLMNVAQDIRPQCDNGTLPITWGPAVNIKIASLLKFFPPMVAFEVGVLNYLDPRVAANIVKSIKSVYPSL